VSADNTNKSFETVTTTPAMTLARALRLGELGTLVIEANTELSSSYTLDVKCVRAASTRMTVDGGGSRYAIVRIEPLAATTSMLTIAHVGAPGGIVRGTLHYMTRRDF
jgi:hypothetical protein